MRNSDERRGPGMPGRWSSRPGIARLPLVSFFLSCLCLAFIAPSAVAAKQVVGFFGSEHAGTLGGEFAEAAGVAVNETGAGPAAAGEIYVLDATNNRIERFASDDNGTPANQADDSHEFVSAWGAGVESGGSEYQVCTVASQCRAGTPTGGAGALGRSPVTFRLGGQRAGGIAVDQDSGDVYVTDSGNFRINVYSGDGAFLRSFGHDVVASGPDEIGGPNERQQLLVRANAGKFSLTFEGESTGPWGTGTRQKNSKTVSQVVAKEGTFAVGQTISGRGIRPGTTITAVEPGGFKLSQAATESTPLDEALSVETLPFNASATEVEMALNALPSIGGVGGSVSVSRSELGPAEFRYEVEFGGSLAHEDLPAIEPASQQFRFGRSGGLTGPTTISLYGVDGGSFTLSDGEASLTAPIAFDASAAAVQSALEALPSVGVGNVAVSGPSGGPYQVQFAASISASLSLNIFGEGLSRLTGPSPRISFEGPATVSALANGGAYEVCVPALGDICKAGRGGPEVGEFSGGKGFDGEAAMGIALSSPDGNPATGTVFVADPGNRRVDTFSLDGAAPTVIGEAVFGSSPKPNPRYIAVDSRGILYAGNAVLIPRRSQLKGPFLSPREETRIERYDTQNADGNGVGFLAPIPGFLGRSQLITVDATGGFFRLSFDGDTTKNIPANADQFLVESELNALPSIGSGGVTCREVAEGPHAFECFAQETSSLEISCEDGDTPLSGGTGCSVETTTPGHEGPAVNNPLAVDFDSDGAGPETDVLYMHTEHHGIAQFGPLNQPGLSTPPAAIDEEHGLTSNMGKGVSGVRGMAVDEADGSIYAAFWNGNPGLPQGVYVLGQEGESPVVSCESLGEATATALTAHCSVEPRGAPPASYRFEYRRAGESSWQRGPEGQLASTEGKLPLSATLEPSGGGLDPNTAYEARLTATKGTMEPVSSNVVSASTLAAAPAVETVGAPIRSATTALLSGRIDPNGSDSTYRFQYGDEGSCDANPCQESEAKAAGSGEETELVAQRLEGLEPGTTYHYRLVGESSAPGSPSYGEDMTVTTRVSDEPLSHGHLPGPPGSDRAYEQVNMADTGGNPVWEAMGFATDGDRALFRIAGGTPETDTGSLFALFYSERTSAGWQVKQVTPPREQQLGANWEYTMGSNDLSTLVSVNTEYTNGEAAIWSLDPGAGPAKLYQRSGLVEFSKRIGLSADGSRAVVLLSGPADPAYPGVTGRELYEVDPGSAPQLVSLLPDGTPCPTEAPPVSRQTTGWVTSSQVFFNCEGQVYDRETASAETLLISGPPVSGPSCEATFLKSTPRGDFFWTTSRLVGEDAAPSGGCGSGGGDIYRYDAGDGSLECSTCSLPGGAEADVPGGFGELGPIESSAIAPDGSRLYFQSEARLLPGAARTGGTYRLTLPGHALAYVAAGTGRLTGRDAAIAPDGSTLLFRSADPRLNQLGGQRNGDNAQYYLYDDEDRALSCASCPQDGSAPLSEVSSGPSILEPGFEGPNQTPLSDDGRVLAFATPTPLVGSDQNTAPAGGRPTEGQDVYEWRDGRLLLVTDGLTNWPGNAPSVSAVSASGRDIFFLAATQYTPDALDAYTRLYDARIGGGFEFPTPPPPCPLEVCQGTPKGAPEEQQPGSTSFVGPGNVAPKAHKKQKHRKRHAKKKHRSKNKHSHRAAKPHGRNHR